MRHAKLSGGWIWSPGHNIYNKPTKRGKERDAASFKIPKECDSSHRWQGRHPMEGPVNKEQPAFHQVYPNHTLCQGPPLLCSTWALVHFKAQLLSLKTLTRASKIMVQFSVTDTTHHPTPKPCSEKGTFFNFLCQNEAKTSHTTVPWRVSSSLVF